MSSKSLLIGLDGAEPSLLEKWSKEGLLPNTQSILDRWYQHPIDTPVGFGDGVFWASVITGTHVGKHGRYSARQYNPATYELDDFSLDTDLGRDPFWYYCSKIGARVGVIDIYSSPLRTGLNGIQVVDWMTHNRKDEPRSWPAKFINKVSENYMPDPLNGDSDVKRQSEQEWTAFHQSILQRVEAKTDACRELLNDIDWDLFCVGYCDAHDVGHQSWHWHDSESPGHPADWRRRHGDPLLQTYQALDKSIGALVETAQADHVFLVAGLGMTRRPSSVPDIQQVLGHYCDHTGSREELIEQRARMPYFVLQHNHSAAAIRLSSPTAPVPGSSPPSWRSRRESRWSRSSLTVTVPTRRWYAGANSLMCR